MSNKPKYLSFNVNNFGNMYQCRKIPYVTIIFSSPYDVTHSVFYTKHHRDLYTPKHQTEFNVKKENTLFSETEHSKDNGIYL